MIQIELVDALPDLNWSEQALLELDLHGNAGLNSATQIYQLGNIAVLGYNYPTLTSPPWVWFMLAEGVSITDVKELKRESVRIPLGAKTCVQAGYAAGERFAAFFGFIPTGDCFTLNNLRYNIFRRV